MRRFGGKRQKSISMKIKVTTKKEVYNFCEPYIIAEIGSNHNGDMALAKELIVKAKEAGADCVKFQSWSKETIFSKKVYDEHYFLSDDYRNRKDHTLESIVEKFSISEQELLDMKKIADEVGIDISSTPFSKKEVDFLVDKLKSPFIKIASMDLNNYPFLKYVASKKRPIIISTGLSTLSEIDKAIALAKKVNGIVFLDIQFGHSTLEEEVLALKKYLMLPEVHLGLDPEFAMKEKNKPGSRIGTIDAVEINQAANILADIVKENNLPPKILIVHRFTEAMVTNYKNIKPLPEVQVVIEMDGWGSPELKKATYEHVIYDEPVQFSGIKLFYKNDLRKPSTRMLTTEEILDLQPQPSYIQYQ